MDIPKLDDIFCDDLSTSPCENASLRVLMKKQHKQRTLSIFPPTPSYSQKLKFRRTHSMIQSPDDFLKEESNDAALSMNNECKLLPCYDIREDNLKRISSSTLCDVLDGKFDSLSSFLIVDCRFPYEYDGGHINGAININTRDALEDLISTKSFKSDTAIIFHCEYSAQRAPRMALHLRNFDREKNMSRYPYLDYPEIYILDGGYSSFYSSHRSRCLPQNYVEMNNSSFTKDCEREMSLFKKHYRFMRTQSYTYGGVGRRHRLGSPSSFSNGSPLGKTTPNSFLLSCQNSQ